MLNGSGDIHLSGPFGMGGGGGLIANYRPNALLGKKGNEPVLNVRRVRWGQAGDDRYIGQPLK